MLTIANVRYTSPREDGSKFIGQPRARCCRENHSRKQDLKLIQCGKPKFITLGLGAFLALPMRLCISCLGISGHRTIRTKRKVSTAHRMKLQITA
jgi:hypothetical protein